jgi:hypothetical protein
VEDQPYSPVATAQPQPPEEPQSPIPFVPLIHTNNENCDSYAEDQPYSPVATAQPQPPEEPQSPIPFVPLWNWDNYSAQATTQEHLQQATAMTSSATGCQKLLAQFQQQHIQKILNLKATNKELPLEIPRPEPQEKPIEVTFGATGEMSHFERMLRQANQESSDEEPPQKQQKVSSNHQTEQDKELESFCQRYKVKNTAFTPTHTKKPPTHKKHLKKPKNPFPRAKDFWE